MVETEIVSEMFDMNCTFTLLIKWEFFYVQLLLNFQFLSGLSLFRLSCTSYVHAPAHIHTHKYESEKTRTMCWLNVEVKVIDARVEW